MTQQNGFYLLKVPFKWKAIYNTLLRLMTKQGISIMEDCTSACSGKGKKLLACWIEFNVACASVEINQRSALILIQDVVNRLNTNYDTDFDLDYYSTLDFEEEPPKVLFGNSSFFVLGDYESFEQIMQEEELNTQDDFIEFISEYLSNNMYNYYSAIDNKNYIYIDDDDDLLFNADLTDDIFIVNCSEGYSVNRVYYNSPLGESIITPIYNEDGMFIYFNNDKTNVKKLFIQLQKVE